MAYKLYGIGLKRGFVHKTCPGLQNISFIMTSKLFANCLQNNDCGAREDILRWADGYILMYSVVCRKSFELLQEVNKTIDEHRRGTSVPVVVIGNKSDLAHMRQVTHDEG